MNKIFNKILLMFSVAIIGIITLIWVLQYSSLDKYYQFKMYDIMEENIILINDIIDETGSIDSNMDEIEGIIKENEFDLRIFKFEDDKIVIDSIIGYRNENLFTRISEIRNVENLINIHIEDINKGDVIKTDGREIREEGRSIQSIKDREALTLIMRIDDRLYVGQSQAIEISNVANITAELFLIILILGLGVGLIISYVLAKKISRPINQLNNITKKMIGGDLKTRYKEQRKDEIGELGKNYNILIDRLESTINKLELELEKERSIDSMRKEFIARISHEYKTPISIIKGYTEALEDDMFEDESDRKKFINTIKLETEKMEIMTKEILDLSVINSGNLILEIERVNFIEYLNAIIEKINYIYCAKGYEVIKEYEQDRFKKIGVMIDTFKIEQVITNLMKNGLEHSNDGKIYINFKTNKGNMYIYIRNKSYDIKENQLKDIWNSFYKPKENKSGQGLGLAIVKGILDKYGSDYGNYKDKDDIVFYFSLKIE